MGTRLLGLTLVLCLGCAASYRPRDTRRVAVISNGWTVAYVRDGRTIPQGFLLSGLARAVKGNPRAESIARTAHSRAVGGFLGLVGGLVCAEIGLIVMLQQADGGDEPSDSVMWMTIGCAALAAAGVGYLTSGMALHWDAVNIYNDGVVEEVAREAPVPWTLGARLFPTDGRRYSLVGYWLFRAPVHVTNGAELRRAIEVSPPGSIHGTIVGGDASVSLPVVLGRTYTLCVQARSPEDADGSESPVTCRPVTVSTASSDGELQLNVVVPYPPVAR